MPELAPVTSPRRPFRDYPVAFFSKFLSFRISPISREEDAHRNQGAAGQRLSGDTVRIAVTEESLFLDLIEP